MANKKHLDLLKKGVVVWNEWRREHPDIRPDLSGTHLIKANLRGANLNGANLSEADLIRANLSVLSPPLIPGTSSPYLG